MQLDMGEGPDEIVPAGARRIVDPPAEHPDPHPDDRLGEHIRVEALPGSAFGDGRPPTGADASGEALENPGTGLAGLAAGLEHDPEELAMVFRESDEGLGLDLDAALQIEVGGRDRGEPRFELARRFVGELLEERLLVLEMEVERPRRVARLGGDRVARHEVRPVSGEQRPPRGEEATSRLLGARDAGHGIVSE
jgi:hypothetical protein